MKTDQKKEVSESEKNFREKAVPFLQEVKENKEAKKIARENGIHIGSTIWHDLLLAFFVLVVIVGILGFLYLAYSGSFKDEINLTCSEIPSCPENTCTNTCPEIEIPSCPVCPEFPDEINIVISNSS